MLPELRDECDAVVNAYGDCGPRTSWCIRDSVSLELQGVPTATINSDDIVRGQADSRALGLPGLPLVSVPLRRAMFRRQKFENGPEWRPR